MAGIGEEGMIVIGERFRGVQDQHFRPVRDSIIPPT